jgi:hypothetical protein
MVVDGRDAVTFRARVRAYDAFDPLSWPGAVLAGPRLLEAATRFTLKNARFFAGYAVDAGRVPLAWTPPGRVFASVTPDRGRFLSGSGHAAGWGTWADGSRSRRAFEALPRRRPLDLRVPADIRGQVGMLGAGALALDGADGLAVVPVTWRRVASEGAYEAMVPAAFLDLARAGPDAPAALTLDHASRWRASEMSGMLLQGEGALYRPDTVVRGRRALLERLSGDESLALVRIRPDRIVWWKGWATGAVTERGRPGPARSRVAVVGGTGRARRATRERT